MEIKAGTFLDLLNKIIDKLFVDSIDDIVSEGDWDKKSENVKNEKKSFGIKITYTRIKWPNGDKVSNPDDAIMDVAFYLPIDGELTDESIQQVNDVKSWEDAKNIQLNISYKNGNKLTKKDLTMKDAKKELEKYKKQHSIDAESTKIIISQLVVPSTDVSSANRLQISLKKVVGSKGTDINLTKINANYDLLRAIEDVDTIVGDDNFINTLPENQEISYEILSEESDDEYDVNECDDFSTIECLQSMIMQSLQLQLKLRILALGSTGEQCDNIFILCNGIVYTLDDVMLTLSNMLIANENCNSVVNSTILDIPNQYSLEGDIIDIIETDVRQYLDCLDVVYINCSRGEQGQLEDYMQDIESYLRDAKRRV